MTDSTRLSRLALRKDQVLEVHFDKLPDPPPLLMKMPGVSDWWKQVKLAEERNIQALHRLVNNLGLVSRP